MKLHVGQGTTIGSLTIFPVWHDRVVPARRRYDTGHDSLVVTEVAGGPDVPQLQVHNPGERPVLVLDGQLFEGGWQHRMATRSLLVPPGQQARVDVACVEQSRWGGDQRQSNRGRRAPTYVRDGFERQGQQSEVWRRVRAYAGSSPTASLVDGMDALADQEQLLQRLVRPLAGQSGVVIGVGSQPLTFELFDHPQTLVEQLPQLLRAAALDGHGRPSLPTPARRARRLVERLERTRLDWEPSVGQLSTLGRATTTHLDVMSLRQGYRPVHLRATHRTHPILQKA